jgi:hypothetical protein
MRFAGFLFMVCYACSFPEGFKIVTLRNVSLYSTSRNPLQDAHGSDRTRMRSGPARQTRNRTEVSGPLLFREQGVTDSNTVIPNSFHNKRPYQGRFFVAF